MQMLSIAYREHEDPEDSAPFTGDRELMNSREQLYTVSMFHSDSPVVIGESQGSLDVGEMIVTVFDNRQEKGFFRCHSGDLNLRCWG